MLQEMNLLNNQTENRHGDALLEQTSKESRAGFDCKSSHGKEILSSKNNYLESSINGKLWFAIRVTYSREIKFKKYLDELGVENFIPMVLVEKESKGRIQKELTPAIHNLVFVHVTRGRMEEIRQDPNLIVPIRYIRDYATKSPVVVPDNQMRHFMQVADQHNPDNLFLSAEDVALRKGDKVRVLSGPFKGIVGTFVRIKRNRRVVVDIPGVMAIASAFVHPNDVEVIEKKA